MSATAEIVRADRRRRAKWIIPLSAVGCYVLLTLAVHFRMLDSFDLAVRNASRSGDGWGPVEIRATRVVDALEPLHVVVALLVIAALLSVLRRSFRPLATVVAVAVPAAVATLATKWAMAHSDPSTTPVGHGSFPSGHMVSVIVGFGLVVLLLRIRPRWGWMLPALPGCLMGSVLIIADIHPATDVVGGVLLALAALTSAQRAGLGQWASFRQTRSVG